MTSDSVTVSTPLPIELTSPIAHIEEMEEVDKLK